MFEPNDIYSKNQFKIACNKQKLLSAETERKNYNLVENVQNICSYIFLFLGFM
jgi:hypothetical protein